MAVFCDWVTNSAYNWVLVWRKGGGQRPPGDGTGLADTMLSQLSGQSGTYKSAYETLSHRWVVVVKVDRENTVLRLIVRLVL